MSRKRVYMFKNGNFLLRSKRTSLVKMQYLFLVFFYVLSASASDSCVVQTEYGKVRGTLRRSRVENSQAKYYYFASIPFGSPPINNLRFRGPTPPRRWAGVYDANALKNVCVQIDLALMGTNVIGDEDCLYLEVSVPAKFRRTSKKFPVMVWIHGGSFAFSSNRDTGPDYLMEKDVVLVQIQYRLYAFGFLTTNDKHIIANIGLRDQVFALKWIQNNIANFGGDPKKVTIFGASAGGASVHLQMLSPQSAGLFHRAISQSGVALSTWTFQRNPLEMTKRLAAGLGINETNNEELAKQLRKVDAHTLVRAAFNQSIMGFSLLFDEIPFLPSVDSDSSNPFFTDTAYESLNRGDFVNVPFMIGHTTEEGSFGYEYIESKYLDINVYNERPELVVPTSLNLSPHSPDLNDSIEEIRQFYFPNTSFADKVNWINLMGQDKRGIRKSADMMCSNAPKLQIYFYIFSYVGSNSLSFLGGAGHYSDVLHILYPQSPLWTTVENQSDVIVRRKLVELWTNFAYYGNPTVRPQSLLENTIWPSYCSKMVFLNIGENLTLGKNPNTEMYRFWVQLFDKYRHPPYRTY